MLYAHIPGISEPVSRLILGSVAFQAQSDADLERWGSLIEAYLQLGGNAIDTARVYGGGRSEETIGRWLERTGQRNHVVLVSKGAHPAPGEPRRVTPACIDQDLQTSLDRLRTEVIDLYLLHRDDPAVPVGPLVECLNAHHAAGRIRAFGGSNWSVQRLEEANEYANAHGLVPFSASSPNVSLARAREPIWAGCVMAGPADVAWHRDHGMPLLSWSSQARGFFTGRYEQGSVTDPDILRVYDSNDNWQRYERAKQIAHRHGCSANQVALAWVLAQSPLLFPLIGPLTSSELQDSVAALDVRLTSGDLASLNLAAEVATS